MLSSTGESYTDVCMVERNHWVGLSVMVWGGISYQQRAPLVIFDIRPGRGNGSYGSTLYRQCSSSCCSSFYGSSSMDDVPAGQCMTAYCENHYTVSTAE